MQHAGASERNAAETGELIATGLTVDLPDGRRLLAGVDLVLEPGQLTAIVGPSGSGKSTLLNALSGIRPASSGVVLYNGQDLYKTFAELRHRIGHVPQDEVLHLNLPLRRALTYTAALRFGSDADAIERNARVTEVLDELGVTERSDITIDRLSGGQQQRASVGLELLTRPSILFFDEPTSGLDPGYERSVTRLFRELSDGGRIVVVVTHAVASLDLCDSVVFLAPGGKLAYVGEPQGALAWFTAADYPEVFLELEANGDAWVERFAGSDAWRGRTSSNRSPPTTPSSSRCRPTPARHHEHNRAEPAARCGRSLGERPTSSSRTRASSACSRCKLRSSRSCCSWRSALATWQTAVPGTGRASCWPCSCSAPSRWASSTHAERSSVSSPCIGANAPSGCPLGAYLTSKFVVLGALGLLQSVVLVAIVVSAQDGPEQSVVFGPPILELGLIVFLTALASVALGLAVSAWVATDAAALVLIPVLLIAQLVLSDSIIAIEDKPGLAQLAWVAPSYWGFRGQAASTHMVDIELVCLLRSRVESAGSASQQELFASLFGEAPCRSTWRPTTANVLGAGASLLGLTGAYAGVAAIGLRRRDPRRSRR